ncbi:hypothetical protein EVAR_27700_1 [Eumeta japonica]|uniref:Uncharacterized protein n=1 Tax=Eumeta variegata TaxID=151549 RepID=A0A4C1WRL4_EUMVA|nr:hypothetical protein EVAR_27700_1 [Eumeta japonica]
MRFESKIQRSASTFWRRSAGRGPHLLNPCSPSVPAPASSAPPSRYNSYYGSLTTASSSRAEYKHRGKGSRKNSKVYAKTVVSVERSSARGGHLTCAPFTARAPHAQSFSTAKSFREWESNPAYGRFLTLNAALITTFSTKLTLTDDEPEQAGGEQAQVRGVSHGSLARAFPHHGPSHPPSLHIGLRARTESRHRHRPLPVHSLDAIGTCEVSTSMSERQIKTAVCRDALAVKDNIVLEFARPGRCARISDIIRSFRLAPERRKGCVRPLSLLYSDASADGVEERSLVPRSRLHARLRRNATMSHFRAYSRRSSIYKTLSQSWTKYKQVRKAEWRRQRATLETVREERRPVSPLIAADRRRRPVRGRRRTASSLAGTSDRGFIDTLYNGDQNIYEAHFYGTRLDPREGRRRQMSGGFRECATRNFQYNSQAD